MGKGIDLFREVIQEKLEEKRRNKMAKKTGRPLQIRETDNGKEKWCSKGKHYQPADLDHFYRDAKSKTGFSSWCRECQRASLKRTAAVQKKKTEPQIKPAPVKKDMVLHLDFSENELLFEDIMAEAADQLRTPAMQAMWLASKAIYTKRNAEI